jgi:cytidylate kinase
MIVGLFGASTTGKTSIAQRVAVQTGCSLRCCGEIVKARAGVLGTRLSGLSAEEHQQIDDDTRKWASANDPCLVEGRYLNWVLAPIGKQITLVRLVATPEDRRARRTKRDPGPLTLTEDDLDLADSAFCTRMYSAGHQLSPWLVLNSSELSVEECVQRVITLMRGIEPPLG